jgi:hypothetical protein
MWIPTTHGVIQSRTNLHGSTTQHYQNQKENEMNIGDRVAHVSMLGNIVGVSSEDLPIVEWAKGEFSQENPDELLVIKLPEELKPENLVAEPTEGTSDGTAEAVSS